ncbi:hypothetical protein HPP92_014923 [Vanilla planifolia]|uniref:Protein MIS12 homolog n=1 Tax=Vanilla planifolia TaxID=51239 RepID=A0A835QJ66_VANPL|nr:hypothetical protein HPP92_015441 [Vanilla planifolia]KAG0475237.1 hypothetical protein HPP92_014923 [Vanilla planifolia]
MEGSGEEAFEALGLKPQLLINDILNMVDDAVDAAFDFFHKEALKLLGSEVYENPSSSEELSKGVNSLHYLMEGVLDMQTSLWEKYCLNHCFSVPEGFMLPTNQDSPDNSMLQSELADEQLDLQLDTTRMKLAVAMQENAGLQRQIHELEKQSSYNAAILEAVQLYEQSSTSHMFKEIEEKTSELRVRMQEAMTNTKNDSEAGGLLNMNMIRNGIIKQDSHLQSRMQEILEAVKLLRSM